MTLNLSEIEFTYDFFSTTMPDGNLLVLNKISENLALSSGEEVVIKGINIIVQTSEDTSIMCSPIIGTSNDYLSLDSAYTDVLGQVLTEDNIQYCTMELFENE